MTTPGIVVLKFPDSSDSDESETVGDPPVKRRKIGVDWVYKSTYTSAVEAKAAVGDNL